MAGVFYIKNENIEKFKDFLKEEEKKLRDEDLIPRIEIEAVLEPKHISSNFWQIFQRFEPFGEDNQDPIFLMKDVVISNARAVGNGEKHLKMSIEKNGKIFNSIFFNGAERLESIQKNIRANITFHLNRKTWQGKEYLDLQILDINVIR
jgi:single-stranded-DNA-specific exonuclease